ncbi:DUF2691 family protein [Pelorhabdus rhamnosifermentans]|uniref:DUF2691 family protein n=1 Tax=Pelorhabdus rhamnosifermentans TaxID=2772457 RepID=UPI001C0614FF
MQAYPEDSIFLSRIQYEDFSASECQIIMIAADSRYVDIYCKVSSLIEKLYDNAKSKGHKYVGYTIN